MPGYDAPQVLIVVRGGVVVEVLSTASLEVLVLDQDERPQTTRDDILNSLSGEFELQTFGDATDR